MSLRDVHTLEAASKTTAGAQGYQMPASLFRKAHFLTWESVSWKRSLKAMYTRKEFTPSEQKQKQRGEDGALIDKPNNLEGNKKVIVLYIHICREKEEERETERRETEMEMKYKANAAEYKQSANLGLGCKVLFRSLRVFL